MVGLVLNVICPLVCCSNVLMMVEIASQRVEASFALSVFLPAQFQFLLSEVLKYFREDLFHHFLRVTPRDKSRFEVFFMLFGRRIGFLNPKQSCIYSLYVSDKQKIWSINLFHTCGFLLLCLMISFSTFAIKMLAKATAILVPMAFPYVWR